MNVVLEQSLLAFIREFFQKSYNLPQSTCFPHMPRGVLTPFANAKSRTLKEARATEPLILTLATDPLMTGVATFIGLLQRSVII